MPDYLKKSSFINFLIIIIIFSLDRVSKFYVILNSESNSSPSLFTSKFLNINLIWNEGIAFGLLTFDKSFGYNVITTIIFFIIILLVIMLLNTKKLGRVGLLFVLGGALGNFFDRLYYSAVPDFIEFYYESFHWFIFNVADIFVTLGIFCLICVELMNKDNSNEKNLQ